MKTFDEKDLITWSNRHKAKNNSRGYFANCINDLKDDIEHNKIRTLVAISASYDRCFDCYSCTGSEIYCFSFFLPVDAVKEEKAYRACKNVQELYELVFNYKCGQLEDILCINDKDRFCINELIGTVIHFKQKGFDTTLYACITGIAVYNNGDIAVHIDSCNFELPELFKNYEIEINGEWLPFGVEA